MDTFIGIAAISIYRFLPLVPMRALAWAVPALRSFTTKSPHYALHSNSARTLSARAAPKVRAGTHCCRALAHAVPSLLPGRLALPIPTHPDAPIPALQAAMLVIGDEILKGSISDSNTPWLAKLLFSRGVDLTRVEFVPDDVDDIARSVLALRDRVGPDGFVFTSGGIGPTHDDVTYEALAKAFGRSLQPHEETVARYSNSPSPRFIPPLASRPTRSRSRVC